MKKLLYSLFLILVIAGHSYSDTVVDGLDSGGVSEGSDVTFGFGIFSSVLDNDTGNEVALRLDYTVDKLTSGNDTGLEINMTDTASPGTSYGINYKVGVTSQFYVRNNGLVQAANGFNSDSGQFNPSFATTLLMQQRPFAATDNGVELVTGTMTQNTGESFNAVVIKPTYNQTNDAAATDLLISRIETAVGSGAQLLIDAQVNSVSKFSVDNNGSSDTRGAVAFSGISTITVDYTMGNFEDDPTYFIECDATLGNISTTLPPVADKKGRLAELKLMSATNGCYFDGNGAETIDGATGKAITTQYDSISVIAGSTQWLIY